MTLEDFLESEHHEARRAYAGPGVWWPALRRERQIRAVRSSWREQTSKSSLTVTGLPGQNCLEKTRLDQDSAAQKTQR